MFKNYGKGTILRIKLTGILNLVWIMNRRRWDTPPSHSAPETISELTGLTVYQKALSSNKLRLQKAHGIILSQLLFKQGVWHPNNSLLAASLHKYSHTPLAYRFSSKRLRDCLQSIGGWKRLKSLTALIQNLPRLWGSYFEVIKKIQLSEIVKQNVQAT